MFACYVQVFNIADIDTVCLCKEYRRPRLSLICKLSQSCDNKRSVLIPCTRLPVCPVLQLYSTYLHCASCFHEKTKKVIHNVCAATNIAEQGVQ